MEIDITADEEHIDRLLAASPVFSGLDADARRLLRSELELRVIPSGDILIKQGDAADGLYLVGSGRLQVVITREDGSEAQLNELGRGDLAGEMALLTDRPRSATVYALRDSHLLFLSSAAFARVIHEHPAALRVISSALVDKLMSTIRGVATVTPATSIAVIPLDASDATKWFPYRLSESLAPMVGTVPVLGPEDAQTALGANASPLARAVWREQLEAAHRAVVFAAAPEFEGWTNECVQQADLVLFVAAARSGSNQRDVEHQLQRQQEHSFARRTELVLLHESSTSNPRGTRHWLAPRTVDRHHHVRVDRTTDYDRAARLIIGQAQGVVFSGGGARGIAHVGVVRAMRDRNVVIDAVAGASIGAIVAGAVARGASVTELEEILRAAVVRKSPVDITLPTVSLAAGNRVSQHIREGALGLDVEDTWLPFLCVSTNLTRGELEIHDQGPGWHAIRSSFSVPGLFPPMRNEAGDTLVDGGVLDNMPVGPLRAAHFGIRVVSIDVGARHEPVSAPDAAAGSVSGWRHLARSLRERQYETLTTMPRILMRLTELGSRGIEDVGDCYIRPAMERIGLLEFNRFDDLLTIGERDGGAELDAWLAEHDVIDVCE
jgi:predicted acylesterase/phospholipase RssA/CRP-like cAMP-binding protein